MLALACPPPATAGPVDLAPRVVLLTAAQKSVLDDFGQEEEEEEEEEEQEQEQQEQPREKEKEQEREEKDTEEGKAEKEEEEEEEEEQPEEGHEERTEAKEEEEPGQSASQQEIPQEESSASAEKPAEPEGDQPSSPLDIFGPKEEEAPIGKERPRAMPSRPGAQSTAPADSGPSSPLDRFGAKEEEPVPGPRASQGPSEKASPEGRRAEKAAEQQKEEEEAEEEEPLCDRVLWRNRLGYRQWLKVVLFEHYRGKQLSRAERLGKHRLQLYTHGGTYRTVPGSQILEFEYYEERMGKKAARELGVSFEELASPGWKRDLSGAAMDEAAKEAEAILTQAIEEHDSAVQRRLRRGPYWNEKIRQPLLQARLNLRLSRLDAIIKKQKDKERPQLQQAEIECDRLRNELSGNRELLRDVYRKAEQIVELQAKSALKEGDYAKVRRLLEGLTARYADLTLYGDVSGGTVSEIREELKQRARKLVDAAQSDKEEERRNEAMEKLEEAVEIWPQLSKIDELRHEIGIEYPILRCAYSELPRRLCPITARFPVERHAASLILESLVRWVDDPKSGAHYEPQLADGLPEPLVRGRDFRLCRTAWSDSTDTDSGDRQLHFCLREDVRRTLEILKKPTCPGHSPAWSNLLQRVYDSEHSDYFGALVRLERDHWQPLSLMDFPILPSSYFRGVGETKVADRLKTFAERPVGTGPYRLAEDDNDEPGSVRFVANPHYRGRDEGLPRIREIVFRQMTRLDDVEGAFLDGDIHLIYDVPKELVSRLIQRGQKVATLRTPTVTFLAPNYHKDWPNRDLLADENVRLAIAHAIDREALLKQYFRPGGRAKDHAALTGPYPKTATQQSDPCWAYNTAVPAYRHELAEAYAEKAREVLGDRKLTLVYPAGNPDVQAACRQIADQVNEQMRIELVVPEEVPREQSGPSTKDACFYDQVTKYHNFDLAYWTHTFEDSTYWLEPLLDGAPAAREPGGLNFMGYVPDEDLARLFREIRRHKQFRRIQGLTHEVHEHVHRKAIIIPLWQRDVYVALGDRLEDVTLDPFVLFGDVEHWNIRPE
jgi:hypothetical protein